MNPPPVCTGSGTIAADFQPVVSNLPVVGLCGICGQMWPLMYDSQTLAPHPYEREEGKWEDDTTLTRWSSPSGGQK